MITSIGRLGLRGCDSTAAEQQLMQRARDPLLVGELLLRTVPPEPEPGPGAKIPQEAMIMIAGALQRPPEHACSCSRQNRYPERASLLEETIAPQKFEPSPADRHFAVDLNSSNVTVDEAGSKRGPVTIALLTALGLIMLLLPFISG